MDSDYFFSSKAMNIAVVVFSKGLVNRPCRGSTVAFASAITKVALVLTEAA